MKGEISVKLEETRTSVFRKLVDAVSTIRGAVAIILFGSVARGDYDEYSDYDFLVVFEDRASLWREWDLLFTRIGALKLNVHAIPQTIDELRKASPVFLEELEKNGKVLFARAPFGVSLSSPGRKPFSVVSYDLSMLSCKEKMRALYDVYEKGGAGLVGDSGGVKLTNGCVMLPRDAGAKLVNLLESRGAKAFKIDVLVENFEHSPFFSKVAARRVQPRLS